MWAQCDGYQWRVDVDEQRKLYTVLVRVPLPDHVNKKNLDVRFESNRLRIAFKTTPPRVVLDGQLHQVRGLGLSPARGPLNAFQAIKTADSTWVIESEGAQRVLVVELSKRDAAEHWPSLLANDEATRNPEAAPKPSTGGMINGVHFDLDAVRAQQRAASGTKVRSVADMERDVEVNKLAMRMPADARNAIQEMYDAGMSSEEVHKLVTDAVSKAQSNKE